MTINLDLTKHSEAELIDLNRRIVAYVAMKRRQETAHHLVKFDVGNQVWFIDQRGHRISGTVVRVNAKTVSIHSEDHRDWRVSPQVVRHSDLSRDGDPSKIIELCRH